MVIHVFARYNLGCAEEDAGRCDIALQHWMISAKLGHQAWTASRLRLTMLELFVVTRAPSRKCPALTETKPLKLDFERLKECTLN